MAECRQQGVFTLPGGEVIGGERHQLLVTRSLTRRVKIQDYPALTIHAD
jgi:hypothetical protein